MHRGAGAGIDGIIQGDDDRFVVFVQCVVLHGRADDLCRLAGRKGQGAPGKNVIDPVSRGRTAGDLVIHGYRAARFQRQSDIQFRR